MEGEALQELRSRRDELRTELAAIGELRPGSLVGRYRKCGKANCHCAQEGAPGHGPSWSLTHRVGGKTLTRIIPQALVARTKAQIAEYRRLRELTRQLVEVSERLSDAQLRQSADASQEAEKKGPSKRPSKRKSQERSRR